MRAHSNFRVMGALVLDPEGTEFPTNPTPGMIALVGTSLYAYVTLNGVLTWFPIVRNVSKTYIHTQSIPAMQWTVNHKFADRRYWFQAKDNDNNYLYPASVTDIDDNTFVADFAEPVTGTLVAVCVNDLDVSNIVATSLTIGDAVVIDDTGIKVGGEYLLSVTAVDAKIAAIANSFAALNGSNAQNFATKDLVVSGNLTVNGENVVVNATTVTTADNTITLNKGEVGAGVTKGSAGLEVDRGSLPKYMIEFDESDDMFKVGMAGDLQTIASRQYVDAKLLEGDKVGVKTFNGAVTCDYQTDGPYIAATVTGPTTITISGIPDATKAYGMTFELTNAGSNITWPASVVWLGTAPTLRATGVSMVTLVTRNGGATYFGSAA